MIKLSGTRSVMRLLRGFLKLTGNLFLMRHWKSSGAFPLCGAKNNPSVGTAGQELCQHRTSGVEHLHLQQWDSWVVSLHPESDFLDLLQCKCIFNYGTCLKASPLCSGSVTPLLHCQLALRWVVRQFHGWEGWTGICGLFKSSRGERLPTGEANTFWGFDCRVLLLFEQLFLVHAGGCSPPPVFARGLFFVPGWIESNFRHSFSTPNPVLTVMPQVVACLHFDPGQPCLRLLPRSLFETHIS